MHQPVAICFAAALLTVHNLAQEPAPQANLANKQTLLQKALRKMDSLPSCAFTARLQGSRLTPAANPARPAAAAPQAAAGAFAVAASSTSTVTNTEGGWSGDLLWASANDGKDQVVWHGRRMVGRQGQEPWRLRQGVVGDGVLMPKLFDPATFFQALLHSKLEVIHADVGALEDRPVEILTVSISGDDAYDVLWSGLVPDATTNGFLGTRSVAVSARGRNKPEIEIDVAVWLDPGTSRVQQCKLRCYTKGAANAGGQVGLVGLGAGPGAPGGAPPRPAQPAPAAAPESAEPAPEAPAGPPVFQDGLPMRAAKSGQTFMVVSYDLTFANHEVAVVPALDEAARALLGLTAPSK